MFYGWASDGLLFFYPLFCKLWDTLSCFWHAVAVVACVAFASQGVQASTVQVSVENVMQDDFVKIEVKELPQAVQDAIAKSYEGSTVKEAYVAGADGAKKYKVVLVDKDQKEQTVVLNEKGEVIE